MNTEDFYYSLPPELIAQQPPKQRAESRLLVPMQETGGYQQLAFSEFHRLCNKNDLLVLNDTRVIPARLFLAKPSGGKVEVMLERFIAADELIALVRSNRPLKSGVELLLAPPPQHKPPQNQPPPQHKPPAYPVLRYLGKQGQFGHFKLLDGEGAQLFHRHGRMPLPPYIQRHPAAADAERYQTVYAANEGAVAAPTAGLHFDKPQLARLSQMGLTIATLTLHVGAATFQPIKVAEVQAHPMHPEWLAVSPTLVAQVAATKAKGGRVIAVGTTTTRALEAAAQGGELQPYSGNTRLFIYPGYEFKVVDAMVTNFHLPKSTLLMMISAFSGKQHIFAAYQFAIDNKYRFFSYGDALFLQRQ